MQEWMGSRLSATERVKKSGSAEGWVNPLLTSIEKYHIYDRKYVLILFKEFDILLPYSP